jgi:mono/diheme cytochrome c family protein
VNPDTMPRFKALLASIGVAWLWSSAEATPGQPTNSVTSPPLYVLDNSGENSHTSPLLPDGVMAWEAVEKSAEATNGQEAAKFTFAFTNISPEPIAILSGVGSCSCTTVQLPETPWLVQAGANGEIGVTIDLTGKSGTLFKSVIINTDKGIKNLMLSVKIQPPPPPAAMTDAQRAQAMATAKADRQAVFRGDCVKCHAKDVQGKYGQDLFAAVCAVCHEAVPRPTMVPDLHHLKDPTSEDFWRVTVMPAFATSQGGPLTDAQINTLAAYLAATIPPHPTSEAK